jgi:hypothetical protein
MKSRSVPLFALVCALTTLAASPAQSQDSTSLHVSIEVPDSVAHMVDRASPERSRFAIVSQDGKSELLLMDTTIVAQMTDRGLAVMNSRAVTDTIKGAGTRLFARMVLGALVPVLDHGIAYHLRDLADAKYADGRLQLLRANGDEVFRNVEIGNKPIMEGFAAADARRFAARAREARARLQ